MNNKIGIKEKASTILSEASDLWYTVVPERMKRGGHPGVEGHRGDEGEPYDPSYYIIKGAIFTLEQVADEIKLLSKKL